MDTPKDGVSKRDHLMQAGVAPEDPEIPDAGAHILQWFWQLHRARQQGFGPAPISYSEIAAWSEMTGNHPTREEVTILKHLDMAALDG